MGLPAIPIDTLERHMHVVRGLLDREIVEWDCNGSCRKIRFLNPELELCNTTDPVEFHVAAMGPRMRTLTACNREALDCRLL